MRLILASASPRRQELLAQLVSDFEVLPADIEEHLNPALSDVREQVADLAYQKAVAVAQQMEDSEPFLVLGADTIVYLQGQILVKPRDEANAEELLAALSGKQHQVMTGLALVAATAGQWSVLKDCVVSDVTMRETTVAERQAYIATGEPMDKAGAYAIQGGAAAFITATTGSYENIVGLPLEATRALLKASNFPRLRQE